MDDSIQPNVCNDTSSPLVEGAPVLCRTCNGALCLRKQVINLALGNSDEMYCLRCLGAENDQQPEAVLRRIKGYIQQRDCFRKEWRRYSDVGFCPDPEGCLPKTCFDCES